MMFTFNFTFIKLIKPVVLHFSAKMFIIGIKFK